MTTDHSERTTYTPEPTTTSGVQSTYYGFPAIKAPHWRWLVIVYFFLGGIAGGSFTIGSLATLSEKEPRLARAAHYLGMAALMPSPILLILDLGRPERFLHMLRIVKLRSPLSLGSWALVGISIFGSGATALQLLSDLAGRPVLPGLRRAMAVLTLPFSLFFTGYTGVLLAATNVPLWARNYLLIGPTFVASSFSTSLAALSLILSADGKETDTEAAIARVESVALAGEFSLLMMGLIRLGRLGRPLTSGMWGALFWPITVLAGLVAPIVMLLTGGGSPSQRRVAAVLALIGGFSLRMVTVFAGKESARRPEDYFEYTSGR